jgi:hypothetical protein
MIGGGRLHPAIVPDPYLTHVFVKETDSWLIMGNPGWGCWRGRTKNSKDSLSNRLQSLYDLLFFSFLFGYICRFWDKLGPEEALSLIRDYSCATKAAKKLADFACSYGAEEDISVLVVKFCLEHDPTSLANLSLPQAGMSNAQENRTSDNRGSRNGHRQMSDGPSKPKKAQEFEERLPELRRSVLPLKARQREISRSIDSLIHQAEVEAGRRPKSRLEAYHGASKTGSWLQSFNSSPRRSGVRNRASSLTDLHSESVYSDSSCTSCGDGVDTCSTCSCSSSCSDCSIETTCDGNKRRSDRVLAHDLASLSMSPQDSAVDCDCSYSSSSVCRDEQLRSLEQVLSRNTRILFAREVDYARKSLRYPGEASSGSGKLASRYWHYWSDSKQKANIINSSEHR